LSDFISYLFAIFILTPLEVEISERLGGARSAEIVAAGKACIVAEGPNLLQRAQDDWAWAASNGLGVLTGLIDPVKLLPQANQNCRRVVQVLNARGTDA